VDHNVLNGFDYGYVVTAVVATPGRHGSTVGSEHYESPIATTFDRVVSPQATARPDIGHVWVVPNPFRANAAWDRPEVRADPLTHHIDFMGLPRTTCTIKIWTLAGDLVAQLDHDGSSGDGQAAWNLVTRNGQDVESGVYLFTVDSSVGHQIGRFVVIR
jgi:hypothetical protein